MSRAEPLGPAVRRRRKGRGMSGEALARRAHMNLSYLYALERGERTPTLPTLAFLAEALGTSVPTLLAGTEWDRWAVERSA